MEIYLAVALSHGDKMCLTLIKVTAEIQYIKEHFIKGPLVLPLPLYNLFAWRYQCTAKKRKTAAATRGLFYTHCTGELKSGKFVFSKCKFWFEFVTNIQTHRCILSDWLTDYLGMMCNVFMFAIYKSDSYQCISISRWIWRIKNIHQMTVSISGSRKKKQQSRIWHQAVAERSDNRFVIFWCYILISNNKKWDRKWHDLLTFI